MPFTVESINKVSVVIPVYNEQESLPLLIKRTSAVCEQLGRPYEMIFVDDGSNDNSVEILTAASEAQPGKIIAILLNRNYGQHAAIMAGFSKISGDLVVTLDADLQNPPEEIPRLVALADQGYDVVGSIRIRRKDSFFRKTASQLINLMIQRTTGQAMGDYGCMLRAYRRHIVDAMLLCQERSTFIPLLANMFAKRTTEIEVRHAERIFGESKYSLMKLVNLMYDLLTCLTTAPLRLLSVVGSIIACSGFILALILIVLRFLLGPVWAAEGVFTLFALLFMFVGAQFVGMGLLGEYIGRIYNEVRARPRYVIEKIIGDQGQKNNQEAE